MLEGLSSALLGVSWALVLYMIWTRTDEPQVGLRTPINVGLQLLVGQVWLAVQAFDHWAALVIVSWCIAAWVLLLLWRIQKQQRLAPTPWTNRSRIYLPLACVLAPAVGTLLTIWMDERVAVVVVCVVSIVVLAFVLSTRLKTPLPPGVLTELNYNTCLTAAGMCFILVFTMGFGHSRATFAVCAVVVVVVGVHALAFVLRPPTCMLDAARTYDDFDTTMDTPEQATDFLQFCYMRSGRHLVTFLAASIRLRTVLPCCCRARRLQRIKQRFGDLRAYECIAEDAACQRRLFEHREDPAVLGDELFDATHFALDRLREQHFPLYRQVVTQSHESVAPASA